ncbi:hypothetical protein GALL_479240 [mine drainage metagenome]|uniref:Uncharacterized protein n=1 Tax=mine drainage metagenome TaxID=410659 RepID=A0A1J5PGB4_9ZZZZ
MYDGHLDLCLALRAIPLECVLHELHVAVRFDQACQMLAFLGVGVAQRLRVEQTDDLPVEQAFPGLEQVLCAARERRIHQNGRVRRKRPGKFQEVKADNCTTDAVYLAQRRVVPQIHLDEVHLERQKLLPACPQVAGARCL